MVKYKFRHGGTLEYEFNDTFYSQELSLGTGLNYQLVRPFGSTDVFNVSDLRIQPRSFMLVGVLRDIANGDIVDTQVSALRDALVTCDRLLSTDRDGNNEAYVDCQGASQIMHVPLTPSAHKLTIEFWVSEDMWRLLSDDSRTVI